VLGLFFCAVPGIFFPCRVLISPKRKNQKKSTQYPTQNLLVCDNPSGQQFEENKCRLLQVFLVMEFVRAQDRLDNPSRRIVTRLCVRVCALCALPYKSSCLHLHTRKDSLSRARVHFLCPPPPTHTHAVQHLRAAPDKSLLVYLPFYPFSAAHCVKPEK